MDDTNRFQIQDRPNYIQRVVPFEAGDGMALNLVHVRGKNEPTKGPVILVHGAGVRAQVFCAPVKTTIVDALIAAGYDVWLENWRASIVWDPNEWNLDQAAVYDHPRAVAKMLEETGARKAKAVIHCQGSTSFTMSALAGLVPDVTTIVSNAVSTHPVVPSGSSFKLNSALPLLKWMTKYLNPHWGIHAPGWTAKLVSFFVAMTHHECNNAVCKQVSFTYGFGKPALWQHENLSETTHAWLEKEFAAVPLTFFDQIKKCIERGNLVSLGRFRELPEDFCGQAPQTDARFSFFAGQKNLCFLPAAQIKAWEWFDKQRHDYHSLHVYPEYSHLDVFMGSNSGEDIFPTMIAELDKTGN